ncbi:MAG: aspartate/glutamate racemase family protein [Caldilineaceae bacterium]|nr:aspartate/glutamate racemase family protein [Caldilineaceae bacterium]
MNRRPRILLINPNTTPGFTQRIQHIAAEYAAAGTIVEAVNPQQGPRAIESIYDELLSAPATLELVLQHAPHVDAFVIACYSDHPVIYAAREITTKPVVGIAEATMHMACMLGHKFSVVTTNRQWEPLLWDAVHHYGLAARCASVRSTGLPVLALEEKSEAETYALIHNIAQRAVEQDGADVICLGCAGMSGMDKRLTADLSAPVLDGVICALKFLEGMVHYGISTSKRLAYAKPEPKTLDNLPTIFATAYGNKAR